MYNGRDIIQTYQAIYRTPVNQIAVPEQFRMGNFEVVFKEIPADNAVKKAKNTPNPLLRGLMTFNDDLIAPTTDIEDWECD